MLQKIRQIPTNTIIWVLTLGVLSTIWGYKFGNFDHVEQLPLVKKAVNDNYLLKDFFISINQEYFSPRNYYIYMVAFLAKMTSIPLTFFTFTLLINTFIVGIAFHIGKKLAQRQLLGGYLASAVVATVVFAPLGWADRLHTDYLIPGALVLPFLYASTWYFFTNRIILGSILAGISCLFHPLMGLEIGLIAWAVSLWVNLPSHRFNLKSYIPWYWGLMVLILGAAPSLVPYLGGSEKVLSDEAFIDIYGKFRHPHHVLGSYILRSTELVQEAIFYLLWWAVGLFLFTRQTKEYKRFSYALWWMTLGLLLLLGLGYIFIELYPKRIWAIAQPFRLLFILKWWAVLIWSAVLVQGLKGDDYGWRNPLAMAGIVGWFNILVWGPMAFFYAILDNLGPKKVVFQYKNIIIVLFLVGAGLAIYTISKNIHQHEDYYLFLYLISIIMLMWFGPLRSYKHWIMGLHLGLSLLFLTYWWQTPQTIQDSKLQKAMHHQYDLTNLPSNALALADFLKQQTPDSSMLIVPPMLGELRYTAERALVIDFKAFPFQDVAMIEWQKRLFDCYGWTDKQGFDAVEWVLRPNYEYAPDSSRLSVANTYGADYAVLFKATQTALPIIYEDNDYKVAVVK